MLSRKSTSNLEGQATDTRHSMTTNEKAGGKFAFPPEEISRVFPADVIRISSSA
jgi:hypothetical protein